MSGTVWVIERGSYSDYRVEGIFSSKQKAKVVCRALNEGATCDNATVSEWRLDPGYDELSAGRRPYSIVMLRDGTVERISEAEVRHAALGSCGRIWKRTEAPAYRGKGIPDALTGDFWGKDEDHAIKVAGEHRVRMIANGEWPAPSPASSVQGGR